MTEGSPKKSRIPGGAAFADALAKRIVYHMDPEYASKCAKLKKYEEYSDLYHSGVTMCPRCNVPLCSEDGIEVRCGANHCYEPTDDEMEVLGEWHGDGAMCDRIIACTRPWCPKPAECFSCNAAACGFGFECGVCDKDLCTGCKATCDDCMNEFCDIHIDKSADGWRCVGCVARDAYFEELGIGTRTDEEHQEGWRRLEAAIEEARKQYAK